VCRSVVVLSCRDILQGLSAGEYVQYGYLGARKQAHLTLVSCLHNLHCHNTTSLLRMSSPAARAEARRKAILSRGTDRLAKLATSARGPEASAYVDRRSYYIYISPHSHRRTLTHFLNRFRSPEKHARNVRRRGNAHNTTAPARVRFAQSLAVHRAYGPRRGSLVGGAPTSLHERAFGRPDASPATTI
jgi:hypothetical protein